ncbi:hypothetical protein BD626DRAFT_570400 [Schizophyllum amplum]|uniref:Uncharacterized protein n=1 Tax=Schizophyllum amplum TaxID=97359 RepID=A0A550CAG3_9AGAR|nr:hypothetical protein BD626DRAFT_570400 [Auriculariopsis ampla]
MLFYKSFTRPQRRVSLQPAGNPQKPAYPTRAAGMGLVRVRVRVGPKNPGVDPCLSLDILAAFKDATLFFSRDGILSNLAAVIPVMDDIDMMLTTAEHDTARPRAIRAAVTVAKRTLNRYYALTDGSDVYRIAMILPPNDV